MVILHVQQMFFVKAANINVSFLSTLSCVLVLRWGQGHVVWCLYQIAKWIAQPKKELELALVPKLAGKQLVTNLN